MDNNKDKKERQIDNLINIVENHTRTKRHLEQYSEIGNPKNKENAREKQEIREQEIQILKNELLDENNETKEDQIENIIDNYQYTKDYIDNNYNVMPEEMLSNLKNKQENRKTQLGNLINNIEEGK